MNFRPVEHSFKSILTPVLLSPLLLCLSVSSAMAGSATWNLNPISSDWKTAANWTPATVPNSTTDTATFANSSVTSVNFLNFTALEGIDFSPGADAFVLNVGSYNTSIFGHGITNDSSVVQTLTLDSGGGLAFLNAATAGNAVIRNSGGIEFWTSSNGGLSTTTNTYGVIVYRDSASAGQANITNNGGQFSGDFNYSHTLFGGSATAENSVIVNSGGIGNGTFGGYTTFDGTGTTSAGDALITANGGSNGGGGGVIDFAVSNPGNPSASNATLIANGAASGETGGLIEFGDTSDGGTARVEVFGNGSLDISSRAAPGMSIGSLEGDGSVFLGGNNLTVGANNLITTFSGVIQDGGIAGGTGGSLTKIGTARLTISNANTYTGQTTVNGGTLLVTNRTGSATGNGRIFVNAGTLGGTGRIAGQVIVGTGNTRGILAPGIGTRPGRLGLGGGLIFNAVSNFKVDLNSDRVSAEQVVTKGVNISGGTTATITIVDLGTATLPIGTAFTIISNTTARPINGTFSNLPDGSTITVGNNTFQANYEGGDGNDLTLTVL